MSHMVIFQTPEGSPGYHQADELEDAIDFVETLRNEQHVEEARIFRMEEVPFEFRGYFRVELMAGLTASEAMHPIRRMDLLEGGDDDVEDDEPDTTDEWTAAVAVDDERMGLAAVGRRGLFGR